MSQLVRLMHDIIRNHKSTTNIATSNKHLLKSFVPLEVPPPSTTTSITGDALLNPIQIRQLFGVTPQLLPSTEHGAPISLSAVRALGPAPQIPTPSLYTHQGPILPPFSPTTLRRTISEPSPTIPGPALPILAPRSPVPIPSSLSTTQTSTTLCPPAQALTSSLTPNAPPLISNITGSSTPNSFTGLVLSQVLHSNPSQPNSYTSLPNPIHMSTSSVSSISTSLSVPPTLTNDPSMPSASRSNKRRRSSVDIQENPLPSLTESPRCKNYILSS